MKNGSRIYTLGLHRFGEGSICHSKAFPGNAVLPCTLEQSMHSNLRSDCIATTEDRSTVVELSPGMHASSRLSQTFAGNVYRHGEGLESYPNLRLDCIALVKDRSAVAKHSLGMQCYGVSLNSQRTRISARIASPRRRMDRP